MIADIKSVIKTTGVIFALVVGIGVPFGYFLDDFLEARERVELDAARSADEQANNRRDEGNYEAERSRRSQSQTPPGDRYINYRQSQLKTLTTMIGKSMKKPLKPGMPFAGSRIAEYLTKRIAALQGHKTQRQIAQEIGYDKPSMISMFKRGEARVPLDKIPLLAKALNVDAAVLFRLGMEQYWQDPRTINDVFGTVVSKNEAELVQTFRKVTNETDQKLTVVTRKILTVCFTGLRESPPP